MALRSAALPVIDMEALFEAGRERDQTRIAAQIRNACRESGFFYVSGHGVGDEVIASLEAASRRFFSLPSEDKMQVRMARGGAAWRGFFPVGGELTSGRPDIKEGLYFGTELSPEHPRVVAGWPLHGANLWPSAVPELRPAVDAYLLATARAAQALLRGVALALELPAGYFASHYTAEPTVLFRIFHYPSSAPAGIDAAGSWGVGEHTDYGLLTLLAQDGHGGLEVKTPIGWVDAPPLPGTLVCNIGDMLDRLTGGWFRSTPHRVRRTSGHDRLSFPLFFDPDFAAEMHALPARAGRGDASNEPRWDAADLHAFEGTYGDYLLGKLAKVFPALGREVLSHSLR